MPASDCTGSAAHITITSSTFSVQIFVHFIGNVNWHRFNCCRNCCHRHHHHYHSQFMPFVFISLDCNIALGGTEAGKGVRVKVEPDFTPYCFDIRHPTLQFCPFPFPFLHQIDISSSPMTNFHFSNLHSFLYHQNFSIIPKFVVAVVVVVEVVCQECSEVTIFEGAKIFSN